MLKTGKVSKEDWIEKKMRKMHRDELKNQIDSNKEKGKDEKTKVPKEEDWLKPAKAVDEDTAPAWVKESKASKAMQKDLIQVAG